VQRIRWLAVLLFIAVPVSAQNPPLEGLKNYGCTVKHVEGEWRLEVWAWHGNAEGEKFCGPGHDWCIGLARDASLDKALRRCNAWFKAVEKKTKPKAHK
jgi:hypothetical protein